MANPNEAQLMEQYNQQLQTEAQLNQANLQASQQMLDLPEPDVNLIREQLDLGPELKRIDYLLRSYTLINGKWEKPKDNNLIILSDYGVHIIREFISWYVNKNTLLSNYEEEMILDKMKDASTTLNELIFRSYEKIFLYPTFTDCKDELVRRLERRAEIKQYAYQLAGVEKNKKEVTQELFIEIQDKIEYELEKIKQEMFKTKLKRFSFILRVVQDTIHSTYNRAWKGQERNSLRRHMQVTETRGGFNVPQMNGENKGIKKWFGK